MKTKHILLIACIMIVLSSCAAKVHQVKIDDNTHICGFWLGLWHGVISPITFVISLFSDTVTVWDVNNNGGWYTFGFLLGIGALSGGSSYSSKD